MALTMSTSVSGGGVGVSAHGNVRVVTERSTIGMPEVGIGFVPDVGGTYLLSRAPGELGTHVALTTARMSAGDAIACGFADHFVPSDRVGEFDESVVRRGDETRADLMAQRQQFALGLTLVHREEHLRVVERADGLRRQVVPEGRDAASLQRPSERPDQAAGDGRSPKPVQPVHDPAMTGNEPTGIFRAELPFHPGFEQIAKLRQD